MKIVQLSFTFIIISIIGADSCSYSDIKFNPHSVWTPVKSEYSQNEVIRWSCDSGYQLKGPETSLCRQNGTFTFIPYCIEVTCPTPLVKNHPCLNWTPQKIEYSVNEEIHWSCDNGFHLNGDTISVCTTRGMFTTRPKCVPTKCTPPRLPNMHISPHKSHYYVRDILTLSCTKGFRLTNGRERSLCGLYEKYIDVPKCEVSHCLIPTNLSHNNLAIKSQLKEMYNISEVIEFECYNGLVLDGTSRSRCLNNGTFTRIPKCVINPFIVKLMSNISEKTINAEILTMRKELRESFIINNFLIGFICLITIIVISIIFQFRCKKKTTESGEAV